MCIHALQNYRKSIKRYPFDIILMYSLLFKMLSFDLKLVLTCALLSS